MSGLFVSKRKSSRTCWLTFIPHPLYNSFAGAECTTAFQEAPVTTSVEVPRGWCAFRKLSSRY
jgi:hypothetical protein